MRTTAQQARAGLDQMLDMVADYLETGGPFPECLHLIALVVDLTTQLLGEIEGFFDEAAAEAETWTTTRDLGMTEAARERLEAVLQRHRRVDMDALRS